MVAAIQGQELFGGRERRYRGPFPASVTTARTGIDSSARGPERSVHLPFAFCAHDVVMTTTEDQGAVAEENRSDETGPVGSPIWAAAHARHLLTSMPNKWAHTREVARHARWVASGIRPDDRDLLVAVAYLHDIGYDERIAVTGFHPLDGARHLRGLGLNELACLVAHHTGAHVEADERGLTAELAQFPRPTGPVADALTYCDVTSGPTGQAIRARPSTSMLNRSASASANRECSP